jgi:hypothetical protein
MPVEVAPNYCGDQRSWLVESVVVIEWIQDEELTPAVQLALRHGIDLPEGFPKAQGELESEPFAASGDE